MRVVVVNPDTTAAMTAAIETNLMKYGLDRRCAQVRASEVPVPDGVAAAVATAEALVGLGLATSRRSSYARPRPKPYAGLFAGASPAGRGGDRRPNARSAEPTAPDRT